MTPRLAVQQLEARDTPAATQFADIMPGVWGSYPQNLTPSGGTLFFSADNGHGYELYATDGATTKMVKDIRPGLGGSDPADFSAAGNGVVLFTADDGGGRQAWRSDGTAAGTQKVNPLPDDAANGGIDAVGWKGERYSVRRNAATNRVTWWKTDGITNTLLKDLGTDLGPYPPRMPALRVAGDRVELTWQTADGQPVVWQTDGTPGGTRLQQQNLTADGRQLDPGVEISPGRFVFTTDPESLPTAAVYVGDGTGTGRQLLKTIDAGYRSSVFAVNALAFGGKAYFTVASNSYPQPAAVGQWVTDGTAAGTQKLDLGLPDGYTPRVLFAFGDKLLISGFKLYAPEKYYLSDGTAAGTTPVVPPIDADSNFWTYAMSVPPDAQNPRGLLLFQEGRNGKVFRTDGVTATAVDTTGLATPPGYLPITGAGNGRATLPAALGTAAYFRGGIYYSGRTDVQRPELWKWDVTTTPAAVGPTVTGVVVNDGAAQRSMVTRLTVSFDQVVSLGVGGVTVVDAAGAAVPVAVRAAVVGGKTVATVTFTGPAAVGGSVADGAYTLKVTAAKVWGLSGTPLTADAAAGFTRLFGDLDGDRAYNREARWMLHEKVGATAGTPAYDARFDFNSDGVIDAADEVQVVRRWLKTV